MALKFSWHHHLFKYYYSFERFSNWNRIDRMVSNNSSSAISNNFYTITLNCIKTTFSWFCMGLCTYWLCWSNWRKVTHTLLLVVSDMHSKWLDIAVVTSATFSIINIEKLRAMFATCLWQWSSFCQWQIWNIHETQWHKTCPICSLPPFNYWSCWMSHANTQIELEEEQ